MIDKQETEVTNETIDSALETEATDTNLEIEATEGQEETVDNNQDDTVNNEEVSNNEEDIPSMGDFEDQIDKSFSKVNVGDIVNGSIVGVSETEVTLDLGSYAEGIIKAKDYSNDRNFSLTDDINIGDEISAEVVKTDDGEGNILLSKKRADFALAWDKFQKYMDDGTLLTLKISQAVKGGVITYVDGIRGFIPASQLSVKYVEDLNEWIGKEVEAAVITVDEGKNRLVFSSKKVELDRNKEARENLLDNLEKGMVVKGTVDNIVPYGAFIKLESGVTGLCHISQLSNKFIKDPNEVVKAGQEVEVKILDVKDGKINLSMKTSEGGETPNYKPNKKRTRKPFNQPQAKSNDFTSDQEATTSIADILKGIKLD